MKKPSTASAIATFNIQKIYAVATVFLIIKNTVVKQNLKTLMTYVVFWYVLPKSCISNYFVLKDGFPEITDASNRCCTQPQKESSIALPITDYKYSYKNWAPFFL